MFQLLITASLPLIKNLLTPLAKCTLIPLGSTATAPVTDVVIQKKTYGSGTAALILNEEMEYIKK